MQAGEPLVGDLRRLLGLSSYEARVYLSLLRGARRPREAARMAGVPPQRVYDVLIRLEERGLVVRRDDTYEPVSPAEALERIASRVLLEAEARARELRSLGEKLEAIAGQGAKEYAVIVEGLAASLAAALEALDRCSEPPVFTVYKAAERVEELFEALKPVVERAVERGAVILVYSGARPPQRVVRELQRQGAMVVYAPEAVMDMLVACDTVIIGVPASTGSVLSVVIRNRLFAEGLRKRLLEAVAGLRGEARE